MRIQSQRDIDDRALSPLRTASLAVMIAVAALILIARDAKAEVIRIETSQAFRKCNNGNRTTCVVDGDTIWLDGDKIRIADIDTPEVGDPKCAFELSLGNKATERMIELINGGPFELHA